jgi:hypothetical protein
LAGNLVKPLLSLYGTEWRERGYGLWLTNIQGADNKLGQFLNQDIYRQPYNILASLKAKLSEVMADKDRDVVIQPCKKFWSRFEAIVEASRDFMEQMCK